MKYWGNNFQQLCWRIKRALHNNRKPILLLFGNGYESQLLLVALHKLRKKFCIVHVTTDKLSRKTRNVLTKFKHQQHLILRVEQINGGYKTFYGGEPFSAEDLNFGFSAKDYFIIAGFKTSEPSLVKAFHNEVFDDLYCPFLWCDDDLIEVLYQAMKDNEHIGSFMFDNLDSDSHHNIIIT